MAFFRWKGIILLSGVCLLLTIGCGKAQSPAPTSSPKFSVHETRIAPACSMTISADLRHVAYYKRTNDGSGRCRVVVDGKEGKEYTHVSEDIIFSPDSLHVAYSAMTERKYVVVVDGVEGKPIKGWILPGTMVFSPDSKCIACFAEREKEDKTWEHIVVVDGEEKAAYPADLPGVPVFSPDSKRVAYVVRAEGKSFAVIDGAAGKSYDLIEAHSSRPMDQRAAIGYLPPGKKIPLEIIDWASEQGHYTGGGIYFSPDSKRVAYVAKSGEQSIVVVDGVEEKTFKGDVVSVRFSPDSKHLLYRVIEPTDGGAKHCFYVMDGMEQKKYAYEPEYMSLYDWFIPSTQISLFSPDSKHVAYWGKTDDKYVLVVDGMERPVFTKRPLPLPIFSPDSQHMACVAISGDKECVVIDGKEMKQFNGVSQLIFGPDSSHIAYVVQIDNNAVVVVDGNAQKEYAAAVSKDKDATRTLALPYVSVWGLCFSPDSKHLAYIVASGDKKLVIVDGTEAVVCEGDDEILCGRIVFDSPTLCHALVKRGEDVFLVEILITE